MRNFLLILLTLVFVACSQQPRPGITVKNVTLRPPMAGQKTAAAYFEIRNRGGSDWMLAAYSPISQSVELHTHLHEGEVMKMRRLDRVKIPSKSGISFKPGGHHLMMFDTVLPEGAEDVPITLVFDKMGKIEITAKVK